jgi:N-methylhydantoinase B
VRVIVKGGEMTIDLSDVSRQVRGFYNSGATTGHACAQVAYKCITSPTDYPINEGSFRPLKVVLLPGTIVSAIRPAAMRWWMTFPMTIVDTIFKALEPVIPHRVIAGHHADLMVALLNGTLPKDGRMFITSPGPLGGGWGAKINEDGVSATVCLNDGDTHNSPVEHVESKYPVLVERQALRNDSGGPGRFRGGLGVEQTIQARTPITVNVQIDRVHCAPWGLAGGKAGLGNKISLRLAGREVSDLPNAKVLRQELRAGDAYTLRSGGGGGFGSPEERDPERVAADVRQGYVSRELAQRDYGVIVDERGRLDLDATKEARKKFVTNGNA